MKIATYNLLKGGIRKVHWTKLIDEHGVDLLLVQESFPSSVHLPSQRFPEVQTRCVWEQVESRRWGSGIYAVAGSLIKIAIPNFEGWAVGAKFSAPGGLNIGESLMVFCVHAPSRKQSYQRQVNQLLDEIARLAGGQEIVIGGDFNLTVSNWKGPDRSTSQPDLAIQARLAEEFGLINCWQTANPNQPLHQTLRWSNNRTVPYHCDGIFVPKSWASRLVSCNVLSSPEWEQLSDHNPVVAEFR